MAVEVIEDRTLLSAPHPVDLGSLTGTDGFEIRNSTSGDSAGWSVAALGDVNGDGYEDFAIGAAGTDNTAGETDAGAVYVVYGSASFSTGWELSDINGTNGFRIDGLAADDELGTWVADAGDVNADGYADLLITAPQADSSLATNVGAAYVLFGRPRFPALFDLSSLDGTNGFQVVGLDKSDFLGYRGGSVGDFNGDGYDDLVLSAPNAFGADGDYVGEVYVLYGKENFDSAVDLSALDGESGFRLEGISADDVTGTGASAAGDVNGDGYDDLLIGAYAASPGGTYQAGRAYLVFGGTDFPSDVRLSSLDGTNGVRINGADTTDNTGWSVAAAGDVNGDGLDDIVIGARTASPGGRGQAGEAYVIFGRTNFSSPLDLGSLTTDDGFRIDGIDIGDSAGTSVSGAGDVNSDGFDDVLIGAGYADPNGASSAGEAYVVYGAASPSLLLELSSLDGSNGFRLDGAAAGDVVGWSLAGGRDINGDGFDDLIIAAPGAEPSTPSGIIDAGFTYVFFGDNFSGIPSGNVGGSTDDSLTGTTSTDTLIGGTGDDTLDGAGGADVLIGGGGDDEILVSDTGFTRVDGGPGSDTLSLDSTFVSFDLDTVAGQSLFDIEVMDLTGSGSNSLVTTPAAVARLSSSSNRLIVDGDGDDVVTLQGQWQYTGTETTDSTIYAVFEGMEVDAQLWVNSGLSEIKLQMPSSTSSADLTLGVVSENGVTRVILDQGTTRVFQADVDVWQAVPDVTVTIRGTTSADQLTVDFSGGNPLPPAGLTFQAGLPTSSPGDSLVLTGLLPGGPFGTVLFESTGPSAGQITFDQSGPLGYSGLEPIIDLTSAHVKVFQAPSGHDQIELTDDADGTFGLSLWQSTATTPTFESITFLNPIDRLVVAGGDGNDTITVGDLDPLFASELMLMGESGSDSIDASSAPVAVHVLGGADSDSLQGGWLDDTLQGQAGDDTLWGNVGQDLLDGGTGSDVVYENADEDMTVTSSQLTVGSATDELFDIDAAHLVAGAGDNVLDASSFSGAVTIEAGAGDDTLYPGGGSDSLDGGLGTDWLIDSGDGDFTLADTLLTGNGVDTLSDLDAVVLTGGAGDNALDATDFSGPVSLYGGDGNDTLWGSAGGSLLDGGDGTDRAVESGDADITLTDSEIIGRAVSTLQSIEEAMLVGGASANVIDATAFTLGPVTIDGGDGSDSIVGSPQDDSLSGGAGTDTVAAAADADFSLSDAVLESTETGTDAIDGFEAAELTGGASDNRLDAGGFSGAVTLLGGDGDDTLNGAAGSDSLDGQSGTDQVTDSGDVDFALSDTLLTGNGNDTLNSIESAELSGQDSDNQLDATGFTAGPVTLVGGAGNDTLLGSDNDDMLEGQDGVDSLDGGGGTDILVADLSGASGTLTLGDTSLSGTLGIDVVANIEQASLVGGAGSDTLNASGFTLGPVTLSGGDGDDLLAGGLDDDSLDGGAGVDSLFGNVGDDQLDGGEGDDYLKGQNGDDTLTGNLGDDTLLADSGDVLVETADADFTATSSQLTGVGTDSLSGVEQVSLTGGAGDNAFDLRDFPGTATVAGGEGDDYFLGSLQADVFVGGAGDDTAFGNAGTDSLIGGDGFDALFGQGGADTLDGGDGTDWLNGSSSVDSLSGGADADTLLGGSQDDTLSGDQGADVLVGQRGDDDLSGGAGEDRLVGSSGDDSLSGGAGDDVIDGGDGTDTLVETITDGDLKLTDDELSGWETGWDELTAIEQASLSGGSGDNFLDASAFTAGPVTLSGGDGSDTLVGGSGDDYLLAGDEGQNALNGGQGNDTLSGGLDDDTLLGGAGDDQLFGNSGDDVVLGEDGSDYVKGQGGADTLAGSAGGGSADPGDNVISDASDTIDETFTFFDDWVDGI